MQLCGRALRAMECGSARFACPCVREQGEGHQASRVPIQNTGQQPCAAEVAVGKSRAFLEMRMPSLMSCSGVTHTASQRFSILRVGPRRLGTLSGRMNMTRPGGYMLMSRCRRSTLR